PLRSTGAARKATVARRDVVPDVLARFDRGDLVSTIAEACGLSRDGVKSILADNGRDHRANVRVLDVEDMTRRYASGESMGQIAAAVGTSRATVERRLRASGVTLRSSGE